MCLYWSLNRCSSGEIASGGGSRGSTGRFARTWVLGAETGLEESGSEKFSEAGEFLFCGVLLAPLSEKTVRVGGSTPSDNGGETGPISLLL